MGRNDATTAFEITNPSVVLVQYSVINVSLHLRRREAARSTTSVLATTNNQAWTLFIRNNNDLQEALYVNTRYLLTLRASG
jgi:hypothetical protein